MTEKTEQQIERERNAVSAMMNAKANMTATLERIATLESQLRAAKIFIADMKAVTGVDTIRKKGISQPELVRVHDDIDSMVNKITQVLG